MVRTMELRTLGRTGLKVSPLCLGAMMFGAWGNTDHDESVKIIHKALDAGINFIDTADVYSQGESEEIVGKALAKVERTSVVLATKVHGQMGENPLNAGNSRRWIIEECENSLRRLGTDYIDLYQIHRPDESDRHRRDPRCPERPGAPGQDPLLRQFHLPGGADRRRPVGLGAPRVREVPHRAAALFDPGALNRARRPANRPDLRDGRHPLEPARRRMVGREVRRGQEEHQSPLGPTPDRYDMSIPGNQRKLVAVDQLSALADEVGITLIELALAFVLEHPAVTSPIIGPRTMKHLDSQLTAPDVRLESTVLDRIDEIVPPGTNLRRGDGGWEPSVLTNMRRRRRSHS